MSPVNWGDAFVQAMRTAVKTVPGLPTTQCWANTTPQPSTVAASIDDGIMAMDEEPMECGPGAWWRVIAAYRVVLYVPLGGDIHAITSLAGAISNTLRTATIAVLGQPVEVTRIRIGQEQVGDALYMLPVIVQTTFDHP
ncbi:MAG: hypothetical protein K2Y26_00210 [Gemmatimonadaceae bacterium]|nr:hypothetical protein [Gemmatimonadaceae bacterium]